MIIRSSLFDGLITIKSQKRRLSQHFSQLGLHNFDEIITHRLLITFIILLKIELLQLSDYDFGLICSPCYQWQLAKYENPIQDIIKASGTFLVCAIALNL
jgi:uncharacterized membrane protein YoaT (DUF817 family)